MLIIPSHPFGAKMAADADERLNQGNSEGRIAGAEVIVAASPGGQGSGTKDVDAMDQGKTNEYHTHTC